VLSIIGRSAMVGFAATAADLIALALLVELFGFSPAAANVPALFVGLIVQFAGNKWFAFRDRSGAWVRQGGSFLAVEACALLLNAALFDRLVAWTELPYLLVRVTAQAAVYFGFSLPLWSRIFSPSTSRPARSERGPSRTPRS
jgi:putative flippase GtrA